jgi:mRNA interferase RelE/StbE
VHPENAGHADLFEIHIPKHVADVIRSMHPDLKRPVKAAVREIAANPECGEPLRRELEGLWKYRVRRFRIIYAIDRRTRTIRLMAVGHRRTIYDELSSTLPRKK